MKDIVIYGAGGFAREVLWLIDEINKKEEQWNVLGFVDDNSENWGKELNGIKILGGMDFLNSLSQNTYVIIAIGDGNTRKKIVNKIVNKKFAVLVHPNISLSPTTVIGEGSIINIGMHVNVHFGCTIGHDTQLENFTSLFPKAGISGGVKVREGATIGAGSIVLQYLEVGSYSMIGSLSNVISNIPPFCTAVGNPAKVIKQNIQRGN